MASDWVKTTLGEIVKLGNGIIQTGPFGSQLHASDYVDEGIPVIMPLNIINNKIDLSGIARITKEDAERLSKHLVKKNDIVYSRRGDVTRKALITELEEGMFCGTGCLLVRPGNSIDARFLTYHLSSPINQEWIIRHAVGATMPNLNTGILKRVPLNIPSLDTQKAIAHILGSLDDKIELNRQMNETLEAMAQALFKSWFVDFDPVIDNALAAGNAIPDEFIERAEQRKGIEKKDNSDIQALFPDEFEFTEEMGWIPKGWESGTLADICFFGKGKINTSELSLENYVSTENMNKEKAGISYAASIAITSQVPKFFVGQTLISNIRPYFKKIWLASFSGGRSNDVLGFQANDAVANEYLFSLLYQDSFFDYMTATSKGTKMPRGDKAAIMSWSVAIPPLILMEEFSNKVKPMYLANNIRSKQAISLSELRDTLLPKLMSGELSIPDDVF
ncbi:restriction endonuclease subunit S [Psychrobacter sp. JB385]|uniref:restriction endonuclease subunit S n=1 Tax=Psychrobacter sp. JB385 TaxID=1434841 RepID=UPI000B3521B5|nr:restriction endonuclease subunit S [Psychrobacter sp. JB385]